MVALDGVAVGRTMVPAIRADGAIMDTGTSLITTSSKDATAINLVRNHLRDTLISWGVLCALHLYTRAHSAMIYTLSHACCSC